MAKAEKNISLYVEDEYYDYLEDEDQYDTSTPLSPTDFDENATAEFEEEDESTTILDYVPAALLNAKRKVPKIKAGNTLSEFSRRIASAEPVEMQTPTMDIELTTVHFRPQIAKACAASVEVTQLPMKAIQKLVTQPQTSPERIETKGMRARHNEPVPQGEYRFLWFGDNNKRVNYFTSAYAGNNLMVFAGGRSNTRYSLTILTVYNIETKEVQWVTTPAIEVELQNFRIFAREDYDYGRRCWCMKVTIVVASNTIYTTTITNSDLLASGKVIWARYSPMSVNFVPRKGFSAEMINDTLYTFGGIGAGTNNTAHLSIITWGSLTRWNSYGGPYLVQDGPVCSVPARYDHASCATVRAIAIFGGKDFNHRELNDLWLFSAATQQWTAVDTYGNVPRPISRACLFAPSNTTLALYEGLHNDTSKRNCNLYTINIDGVFESGASRQWKAVTYLNRIDGGSQPEQHQADWESGAIPKLPFTQFEAHLVNSKTSEVLLHGVDVNEQQSFTALKITNLKNLTFDSGLLNYLESIFTSGEFADIRFRALSTVTTTASDSTNDEGPHFVEIPAHKCIVSSRCPHLATLIQRNLSTSNPQQTPVIDVADVSAVVLKAYLQYLYSGSISLNGSENIRQLIELCRSWNSPHVHTITTICSTQTSVATGVHAMQQLQYDLLRLLQNANEDADASIVCRSGTAVETEEEVPTLTIRCHRVFLMRTQHFRNMFASGMSEAITGVVELDASAAAVQTLLEFLYADVFNINTTTCVEVMILARSLQLTDLQMCCRKMLSLVMDPETTLELLVLANAYADISLRSELVRYVQKNYDQFRVLCDYQQLDKQLKDLIETTAFLQRKNSQK